ncbi:Pantoate-beta-alanine ligase [Irpex rosettiformis]|uniref:Pantoate-beta-alanine ligase n=1 Tax=Irpex rosettiformis TaxID=378272 RepID=A0ACB8UBB5_9APHY|nr:Pantoate-beta-alanine ligase [Irpex rosettiformis]
MSSEAGEIQVFESVAAYREWRRKAYEEKKSVGYVATMGALHEGHASLVRKSLENNDLTVVSIFVNPAQFAPHEDLTSYPRTLPHDLAVLRSLSYTPPPSSPSSNEPTRTPNAVFLPSIHDMYPSGISQDVTHQKGTFVEVKGYSHQMEGTTRPTFFRGVATVVTKLFHIIEPTRTYFGQKDIQQALLLKRLTRDLIMAHPSPENLFIVPTSRDPKTNLALSSRNAYLTPHERTHLAPTLHTALLAARTAWEHPTSPSTKAQCIALARAVIQECAEGEQEIKLDYVEMNDPETFDVLPDGVDRTIWEGSGESTRGKGRPVVLSGAMWVGEKKTRLIDNIILGDRASLGILEG